ncbi:hypothetical protein SHIRM173S_01048 [Streptomyces hirsutus]
MSTAAATSALHQQGGTRVGLVLADLVPASRVRDVALVVGGAALTSASPPSSPSPSRAPRSR